MFQNMKIKTKLLLSFLLVSILPFLVYGAISHYYSSDALSRQAYAKLEAVRDSKKAQLNAFFDERRGDMGVLRDTVATLREAAFEKLRTVQEIKIAQIETFFQRCINDITVWAQNATVSAALETYASLLGEDGAIDLAVYASYEKIRYGASFKQFLENYGYDDILLVTVDGDLVYSFKRDPNLGQNLLAEPLQDTLLTHAFQKGLEKITVSDFAPYPPSGNEPIGFVAAPIQRLNTTTGVLILKVNAKTINEIVHRRQGMGKTGETYLVGRRNGRIALRSDRQVREGRIGQVQSGEDVEKALDGQSGSLVKLGDAENMEIVRYDPLNIPDLNWAMVTTMGLKEVIARKLIGQDEDYFAKFVRRYKYDDLLLIHPQGDVFYAVAHGPAYGQNVLTGDFAQTVLGQLVDKAMQTRQFEISDMELYPTDQGVPAIFMAQPVVFLKRVELMVVLRVSVNAVNAVMRERSGMGSTGETYLVGKDGRMRSDSFRDPEHFSVAASFADPETGGVDTTASRSALAGETGSQLIKTYNGDTVLSAYTPLEIGGFTWALIAETDANEALAGLRKLKILMSLATFIAVVLILCVALVVTRRIIQPVNNVVDRIKAIAQGEGDLTTRLVVKRNDEMGDLAHWFNIFVENVHAIIKEIARNAGILSEKSPISLKLAGQMADDAEQMSAISESVSTATDEMSSNINMIAAAAEQMSFNISNISATSEQMSQNMNTVAGAMEEMSASISGVAANSQQSGVIAEQAADGAATATRVMNGLGEAAQGIGDVTRIISDIAEQTNMLALNATIQAASAGKAGKGFAVIAKEIKELAIQSAESSADIAARIEAVQAETQNAVAIIADITETIKAIHQATITVDNAVKQQNRTVEEISANARETDRGASDIAKAIAEVVQSAGDMSANAGEAAKAATSISFSINRIKEAADEARAGSKQVDMMGADMVAVTRQLQDIVNKFNVI